MKKTRLAAILSAVVIACTTPTSAAALSLPETLPGQLPIVYHPEDSRAPVPQPFPVEEYFGQFVSDISSHPFGVYLDIIDGFHHLRQDLKVMESNMDQTVRLNNSVRWDRHRIERAQKDAAASSHGVLMPFSDALGPVLGAHFRDAMNEHRLPKTEMLFGGGPFARAGGLASSTFVEKAIFNNPRPFIVAPDRIIRYTQAGKVLYKNTKSFPSGHTNQATWTTTLLAVMLPELATQLLARGAEAGENRIVLGVHYPLDVIGGRMTGIAAAADRWNDPHMRDLLMQSAQEIRAELEWRCGGSLATCAAHGGYYTANPVSSYTRRMHYDFQRTGELTSPMVVPVAAPDLLITQFPKLTWEERRQVLELTAEPAGYPLDKPGPQGSWARLNLAKAFSAKVWVDRQGTVHVSGYRWG